MKMSNIQIPASYADICDKSDCTKHAYHQVVTLGVLATPHTEQYQCQSYYENGAVHNCTCGKCNVETGLF